MDSFQYLLFNTRSTGALEGYAKVRNGNRKVIMEKTEFMGKSVCGYPFHRFGLFLSHNGKG
jgi:hypothetical protein